MLGSTAEQGGIVGLTGKSPNHDEKNCSEELQYFKNTSIDLSVFPCWCRYQRCRQKPISMTKALTFRDSCTAQREMPRIGKSAEEIGISFGVVH